MEDKKINNLEITIRNISEDTKEKVFKILDEDKEGYYKSFNSIKDRMMFCGIESDIQLNYLLHHNVKEMFDKSSSIFDHLNKKDSTLSDTMETRWFSDNLFEFVNNYENIIETAFDEEDE